MITVSGVNITSYDFSTANVSWSIDNPLSEDLADYKLNLYRSETPQYSGNDFTLLASGISPDDFDYTDNTISGLQYRKWRELYYVLEPYLSSTPSTKGFITAPESFHTEIDFAAKEIYTRHSYSLLERYGGSYIKVLKARTMGDRPASYDTTLGRVVENEDRTSYGTGWRSGYYKPIEVLAMINAAPKKSQLTVYGEWETSDAILTVGPYPRIAPKDKIIDKLNRRWAIVQVRSTEKGLYIIAQNAQIRLLDKDDIIYKYPITWDN
jgi:hypothetical protein